MGFFAGKLMNIQGKNKNDKLLIFSLTYKFINNQCSFIFEELSQANLTFLPAN